MPPRGTPLAYVTECVRRAPSSFRAPLSAAVRPRPRRFLPGHATHITRALRTRFATSAAAAAMADERATGRGPKITELHPDALGSVAQHLGIDDT
jgi:hypothetical protein